MRRKLVSAGYCLIGAVIITVEGVGGAVKAVPIIAARGAARCERRGHQFVTGLSAKTGKAEAQAQA